MPALYIEFTIPRISNKTVLSFGAPWCMAILMFVKILVSLRVDQPFTPTMLKSKLFLGTIIFGSFSLHLCAQDFFSEYPNSRIVLEATAPGSQYQYDIGEKDKFYHRSESALVFNKRSEEHTSELQSRTNLVCRLLLEKKK